MNTCLEKNCPDRSVPDQPTFRAMWDQGGEKMDWDFVDNNPADALALLWLELKAKGIV